MADDLDDDLEKKLHIAIACIGQLLQLAGDADRLLNAVINGDPPARHVRDLSVAFEELSARMNVNFVSGEYRDDIGQGCYDFSQYFFDATCERVEVINNGGTLLLYFKQFKPDEPGTS